MISGLGFNEIIIIGLIIIMFFGSEDLPKLLRTVGEHWRKIKKFTNSARAEIDAAIKDVTPEMDSILQNSTAQDKNKIRQEVKSVLSQMSMQDKREESSIVSSEILKLKEYKKASSIMLFSPLNDEIKINSLFETILNQNKRLILPYCKNSNGEMGISEIKDPITDLVEGSFGIKEPVEKIRDNFFLSDIQLIICPAVAFAKDGSRLGRGNGYYDRFLKDLKGKIPIIGVSYRCQIQDSPLPFDYHDIMMDKIVTADNLYIIS